MNWKQRILSLGLLIVAASSLPLLAQQYQIWDPETGVPIRQGWHIEWFRGGEARDDLAVAYVGQAP